MFMASGNDGGTIRLYGGAIWYVVPLFALQEISGVSGKMCARFVTGVT